MPDGSLRATVSRLAQKEIDRRARMLEQKERCEDDLLAFVETFWHVIEPATPLIGGWVMDLICDVLMAVTDGHLIRVNINVPPGSTKSTLLNVMWPAWEWGPQALAHLRYLSISYSSNIPIRDNLRFARLIKHPTYQRLWGDGVKLLRDGAELVENNKTGSKTVTSVDGSTTGLRGDRILCLPFSSRILTHLGWMRIGDVVLQQRSVEVAGWDGSNIVWQSIEAFEENPGRELVAVNYDGGQLICTADHLVFSERGYVRASDLRTGQELVVAAKACRDDLPVRSMWNTVLQVSWPPEEGETQLVQRSVPGHCDDRKGQRGLSRRTADDYLRVVREDEGVLSERGCPRENVLHVMRVKAPMGERQSAQTPDHHLRTMQDIISSSKPKVPLLLDGLQKHCSQQGNSWQWQRAVSARATGNTYRLGYGRKKTIGSVVQGLWRGIQATLKVVALLLASVSTPRAWTEGKRKPKRSLRARLSQLAVSCGMESVLSGPNQETRRKPMPEVWCHARTADQSLRCAPHRLRETEHRPVQPDNALPVLPWQDARQRRFQGTVQRRIVLSVTRISGQPSTTYNVRVAPHHNYFADGILVHNCDDLNNPTSVESDKVRQGTQRFVREIMPDRLNDMQRSAIINLQQRTHQGDATGTLIEFGRGYSFVCVPMEFDPLRIGSVVLRRNDEGEPEKTWTDPRALDSRGQLLEGIQTNARGEPEVRWGSPMARAEGVSCWPERFPPEVIASLKAEKGPYAWDSQYQQIPGVRGGGIIRRDWWKLWPDAYPPLGTVIVSVDTATEEGNQNDYNACTAWGAFEGLSGEPLLLLIAAWRERLPLAQLVMKIANTCRERAADYLLIEHKTRGRDVHDEIVRLYQTATWQTILVKPGTTDKVNRLKAVEHLFSGDYRVDPATKIESWSGGIVYAPDRDFADEVIAEVAAFPYAEHDDYVDTVSQALSFVRKTGVVLRKVEWDEMETERQRFRKTPGVPYAIKRS